MKRTWIGAALLLGILGLSLLSGWWMDRCHSPIARELRLAVRSAGEDDWADAEEAFRRAEADWERRRDLCAILADHTPLEEIDSSFQELKIYAEEGEWVHFAAGCACLARQVEAMGEAHGLMWWNIL